MSINVSSGTSASQIQAQGNVGQPKQDFQALTKALQSNDLSAAKAAYAKLTSDNPNAASNNPNSPLAQIGQALQKGDLAGAQKTLASVKGGHHHQQRSGEANGSNASASATPLPRPTDTMGNNVNTYA